LSVFDLWAGPSVDMSEGEAGIADFLPESVEHIWLVSIPEGKNDLIEVQHGQVAHLVHVSVQAVVLANLLVKDVGRHAGGYVQVLVDPRVWLIISNK